MSKFGEISFFEPVEIKTAVGHRSSGDSVRGVLVDGDPLTKMPDKDLKEAIVAAGFAQNLIVKGFGSVSTKEVASGFGVRVEPA